MEDNSKSYIRQTVLSGPDKAAMLFCELGQFATNDMLKYFSKKELKKLRKSIRALKGHYNCSEEIQVLEETAHFGIRRGYLPANIIAVAETKAKAFFEKKNNLVNDIKSNVGDIAKVLSMWLKE